MKNKNKITQWMIVFTLLLFLRPSSLQAQEMDGNALMVEMDKRLNFTECRMVIRIEDKKADGRIRILQSRVEYLKGVGTRLDFDQPVRDKGKSVLMAGSSLWMTSPSVSKAVRLSGRDSFMGTSFTNDDMLNLDKADDYDTVVISQDNQGWNLEMKARVPSVPYPRILARLGSDYLPLSMRYFARSGRESKTVEFSEVKNFSGRRRPSVMTVIDLMSPGDQTTVIFLEIQEQSVNRNRLNPAAMGN